MTSHNQKKGATGSGAARVEVGPVRFGSQRRSEGLPDHPKEHDLAALKSTGFGWVAKRRAQRPLPTKTLGLLKGRYVLPDTFFDELDDEELRAWNAGSSD
ncbi:hypothetical protein [Stappia sp.]|uniref:hypothetical protein n=1 Tax=Stappia sp. TaxID=1870903 RepID=UPI003C79C598